MSYIAYPFNALWIKRHETIPPEVSLASIADYTTQYYKQRHMVSRVSQMIFAPESHLLDVAPKNIYTELTEIGHGRVHLTLRLRDCFSFEAHPHSALMRCAGFMIGFLPHDIPPDFLGHFRSVAEAEYALLLAVETLLRAMPLTEAVLVMLQRTDEALQEDPLFRGNATAAEDEWLDETHAQLDALTETLDAQPLVKQLLDAYEMVFENFNSPERMEAVLRQQLASE